MDTEDRDGGMVIVAYAVILLWLLAIGTLCAVVSEVVWRASLKHYTSASS